MGGGEMVQVLMHKPHELLLVLGEGHGGRLSRKLRRALVGARGGAAQLGDELADSEGHAGLFAAQVPKVILPVGLGTFEIAA